MRTSSLCVLALSVLALPAVTAIVDLGKDTPHVHDKTLTIAERQLQINVCRDLNRTNGVSYVCAQSTNTIASAANCDDTINGFPNFAAGLNQANSYCCNVTLFSPQGVLPLPNASQGNCCPGTPVAYNSCGEPPTMLCCHPTDEVCVEPTNPGINFGSCAPISKAPTSAAPTSAPTAATARPTSAPTTGAPTTESPTQSPTSTTFLKCTTTIGGQLPQDLLPLQDSSGFVQCGCSSTCPSGSHCTFQTDPTTNATEGYCCPDSTALVDACTAHDCGACSNATACAWYGMQGCQLNGSLTNADAACHTCPSNTTAPTTPQDIKTGVPGTCMRRCGATGGKRNSSPRELEYTKAVNSDDPMKWLYIPPNPYDPYYNLYGSGFVPPPPPPPPSQLPPMSDRSCSCDDDCAKIANADCCNDYMDLCVF